MTLRIVPTQIERLEREIDAMNSELEPLRSFILPGGGAGRPVARRARRRSPCRADCGGCGAGRGVNPLALTYLNRLSDHLFVMARTANNGGMGDVLWGPGENQT